MLKFEHQEDKNYSQWEQMHLLKKLYVYIYIKIRKLMQNNKKKYLKCTLVSSYCVIKWYVSYTVVLVSQEIIKYRDVFLK